MGTLLAAVVTAFLTSFLILPVIIKYSLKKNIVDVPGRRKIHKKETPSLGGIAIFLAFVVACLAWVDFSDWREIRFLLISMAIIFFIGVRDDLIPLRAWIKLVGQIFATVLLIFLGDVKLTSLYGLFGVTWMPDVVCYLVTLVTVVVITNSFNLIDGLDGLAGTVATVSLAAFGTWFYLAGDMVYAILSFSMLGAVLAFLIFNWEPSEIFMGDTGALVIGLLLSVLAIRFINVDYALPAGHPLRFDAVITTAACFIIIPLFDTLRIIILRLSKGQSPFAPDKSHVHHAILRLGMNHAPTALILGGGHLFYILLAIVFINVGDNIVLPVVLTVSTVISVFLDNLILRRLNTRGE
jgi:UDP-N-acetylmuramyl pentapeptide phosphotransferase/UDP-N-acetylglucosamine-1-phosphate transferase